MTNETITTAHTCRECGRLDSIVYSGVDALLLGVKTESICYPCANGYEYEGDAE